MKVYVRVKPHEEESKDFSLNDNVIHANLPHWKTNGKAEKKVKKLAFNKIFSSNETQENVFQDVAKEVCDHALQGYYACILAYGQTGSGKTYTMNGGIIPKSLDYLMSELKGKDFKLNISYVEIYNEKIKDLFQENSKEVEIKKIKDTIKLVGASRIRCHSKKEALTYLKNADKKRSVSETKMNSRSSRSHAVVIVYLTKTEGTKTTKSQLFFVDLAGSENVNHSKVKGKAMKEAQSINRSLLELGNTIRSLNRKDKAVQYRNSKLTLLLSNALGGNSMTSFIITIRQEHQFWKDSFRSLEFGHTASTVELKASQHVEYDLKYYKKLCEELKKEIVALKEIINKRPSIDIPKAQEIKLDEILSPSAESDSSDETSDSMPPLIMHHRRSSIWKPTHDLKPEPMTPSTYQDIKLANFILEGHGDPTGSFPMLDRFESEFGWDDE